MCFRPAKFALLCLAAVLLSSFQSGCGKPFNIRPKVQLHPGDSQSSVEVDGVTIKGAAIVDENALYEAFDANLILAGVLPVKVRISNNRTDPVYLKRVRFELQSESGSRFTVLKPGAAYKRLISYYDVSAWTIAGYKESRGDFESYALNQSPLATGESRDGLIFFRIATEADLSTQVTLVVKGLTESRKSETALKLGRLR